MNNGTGPQPCPQEDLSGGISILKSAGRHVTLGPRGTSDSTMKRRHVCKDTKALMSRCCHPGNGNVASAGTWA
jgi:hypothetical protein